MPFSNGTSFRVLVPFLDPEDAAYLRNRQDIDAVSGLPGHLSEVERAYLRLALQLRVVHGGEIQCVQVSIMVVDAKRCSVSTHRC